MDVTGPKDELNLQGRKGIHIDSSYDCDNTRASFQIRGMDECQLYWLNGVNCKRLNRVKYAA